MKFNQLIPVLFLMFLVSCANKPDIMDKSNPSTKTQEETKILAKDTAKEYLSLEVIEEVYPPAKFICMEFFKVNDANKQCMKFYTWHEYVFLKYEGNAVLNKLDYSFKDKVMVLHLTIKR
jgi:hypothetical protein